MQYYAVKYAVFFKITHRHFIKVKKRIIIFLDRYKFRYNFLFLVYRA